MFLAVNGMFGGFLKKFHKQVYLKFFPNYPLELEKVLKDCKSVLDVGCGSNSPIKGFSRKIYSVGVDAFKPSIEKSKTLGIHDKYYCANVLGIKRLFKPGSFDAVLASDLIEHFSKKDSLKLLKIMEWIARKKVIVFTPNGFLPQSEYDNNPLQVHKSGWTVEEMENLGFKVFGISGFKVFRQQKGILKKPFVFWKPVSDFSQFFAYSNPELAFQLLCIKEKTSNSYSFLKVRNAESCTGSQYNSFKSIQ